MEPEHDDVPCMLWFPNFQRQSIQDYISGAVIGSVLASILLTPGSERMEYIPDAPPLIEASLFGSRGPTAVADWLAQVPGEFNKKTVTRLLMTAMLEILNRNPDDAPKIARWLYQIALDAPDAAEDEMWYLDDYMSLAIDGVYGSVKEVRRCISNDARAAIAMQTDPLRDNEILVRCRPGPIGWFFLIVCGGMCGLTIGLTLFPPDGVRTVTAAGVTTFAGVVVLPILMFAAYLVRAQIIANEVGLRWRGLRGWRTARWDEVTDFYEVNGKDSTTIWNVIETSAGRLWSSSVVWTQTAALRDVVAQKATKAPLRSWEQRGKRANENWPYIFTYDTLDNRTVRIMMPTAGLLLWGTLLLPTFSQDVAEIGWARELGRIALCGIFVILLLVADRDTRRRRERIVVTQQGIARENGDLRLVASWQEVQEFVALPQGRPRLAQYYLVITQRGEFDFTSRIDQLRLLKTLIERFAPEAVACGRHRVPDEDNLLPNREPSLTGERLYHYRTRSARAMLLFFGAFALCFGLQSYLDRSGWTPSTHDSVIFLVIAVVFGMVTLWGLWWYRAAYVRTDSLGITLQTPFGKRSLFWGEVQDYYLSNDIGYVIGADARIRFLILIADVDDLKAEIVQRAAHSESREWKQKTRR